MNTSIITTPHNNKSSTENDSSKIMIQDSCFNETPRLSHLDYNSRSASEQLKSSISENSLSFIDKEDVKMISGTNIHCITNIKGIHNNDLDQIEAETRI